VGYIKEERHEQALNKRVLLEGFFTASTLTLGAILCGSGQTNRAAVSQC
jgi:hypothetical protein